ncbi:MAG: hypothetical protein QF655_01160, partial [Candidatus Woesearchaeota archaeon]|nr:hypothetical protein [Candidatus Woesearchaeota archaeon]
NEKISELSGKDIVVDSIRHPGEIEELKKNDGFILIGVHTDAKIRFERLVKRGRVGDAQTFEKFIEQEKRENNDEGSGQQLDKCMKLVDKIINSDGTVEEANKDLDSYRNSLEN